MTTDAQMRKERIERLLRELEYEIVRGVMEREIEPHLHFHKIFPCHGYGDGLAQLELRLWPAKRYDMASMREPPKVKLRVVEGGKP